jgi:type I restriction-modification system DNA methylase subunit
MKQFDFFTDNTLIEEKINQEIPTQIDKVEIEPEKQQNEVAVEYWKDWKPKATKNLGKVDHTHKLTHGWLMPYLVGIDELTNKRWEYWLKVQQLSPVAYYEYLTKGLTDKFVTEAIHCHDYPKLSFSEDKATYNYINSIIDLICGDRSINGIDAFDFLLDWLLFGFGHEDFTESPASPSRDKDMNNKLYEYFDLFPLLMNPYDYFGLMLPDLFSQGRNQKVGFFPTPMSICIAMSEMISGDDKPTIGRFQESAAGTGSIVLAWSNKGLNASITELSDICTKASLVNCYLYAPQFARPLFYLANQSSFVCGNTLSNEIFKDYHEKYKESMAKSLAKDFAPLTIK